MSNFCDMGWDACNASSQIMRAANCKVEHHKTTLVCTSLCEVCSHRLSLLEPQNPPSGGFYEMTLSGCPRLVIRGKAVCSQCISFCWIGCLRQMVTVSQAWVRLQSVVASGCGGHITSSLSGPFGALLLGLWKKKTIVSSVDRRERKY